MLSNRMTLSEVLPARLKSGKTMIWSLVSPIRLEKSKVISSHWLTRVFATLISPVEAPVLEANLIPTSLSTVLYTMIFTVQLLGVKVKVPISAPCCDSQPAQGCPAIRAVNWATVAEVLIPVAWGLVMICTGGLVPFSNTVQVQLAPWPPVSKLIGAFCATNTVLIDIMSTATDNKIVFLISLSFEVLLCLSFVTLVQVIGKRFLWLAVLVIDAPVLFDLFGS